MVPFGSPGIGNTSKQGHCSSMQSHTLTESFTRLGRFLDRPAIARRVVVALLAAHTTLLAYSAYVHSPTLDEPGHLVAGLSHWEFGRFELYRVNPPLVRMVAALPVMAIGYEADWSGFYEGPGARPVFGMGEDFIAANGERSFFLFMIARWACIPFSWLGAIVCYLWARDLYGRLAGLMACTLWCFEPNILAHASLITPDAHATALGLVACYTFWRWLRKPTWAQAALTGVVLGLAELSKTTLILLYPLWPLIWLFYRWPQRRGMAARDWLREAGMLALRMAIGLYILNLGYGFEGSFKSLGEYRFVSELFTAGKDAESISDSPDIEDKVQNSTNRVTENYLNALPVPLPANYLLGIDIQQKTFESYDRHFYLRGEWSDEGWWYYYLYAAVIKVPLGIWGIGAFCLTTTLTTRRSNGAGYGLWRDEFVLLLPAVTIFVTVSAKTGNNEHFRYVLPAFPFIFCFLGKIAGKYLTPAEQYRYSLRDVRPRRRPFAHQIFLALKLPPVLLCTWSLASTVWIYPHCLSYFNEAVGGPLRGAEHLLGSNLDWGQDLLYLLRRIGPSPSAISYYGFYKPHHVMQNAPCDLSLPEGSECARTFAVSVNHIRGHYSAVSAAGVAEAEAVDSVMRSTAGPASYAGYSMLLFNLQE